MTAFPVANLGVEFARYAPAEKKNLVKVIDSITGERRYLQTDRYIPTPDWERVLEFGCLPDEGRLLLVVKYKYKLIGFARLFPEEMEGIRVGNIGIGLLKAFRHRGIGTRLLGHIVQIAPTLGYPSLTADILCSNVVSLRLFSHFGFKPIQERERNLPFLDGVTKEVTVQAVLDTPEGNDD
jgi:RimJ/RimL family protein N-acetyltransferase